MERRERKSISELLHADQYTPQELAELLDIGEHIVQNAAYEGELKAQIVGHDIISVQRQDAITWFNERYRSDGKGLADAIA